MARKKIRLSNIATIKEFIEKSEKCIGDVRLFCEDGYVINGKSIMGIFSMDISKEVDVEYNEEENARFGAYLDNLKK